MPLTLIRSQTLPMPTWPGRYFIIALLTEDSQYFCAVFVAFALRNRKHSSDYSGFEALNMDGGIWKPGR